MRLYERFADKGYHTSIATTFGIDFDAYENIVLPRVRGAGCRNNIVIADGRMLTHALTGASSLPRQAGRLYTVSGARASGLFHPKLFLQIGRRGGRLIIGSANLTAAGLAGNLELVAILSCDEMKSAEQQLVARAWHYLAGLIDNDQQALLAQRDWMLARAPWLRDASPATGPVTLTDGTQAALLTTGGPHGIGSGFAALVDEPVTRLIVISPYWDEQLAALADLQRSLRAAETAILLDPETQAFPKDAADNLTDLQLYKRDGFQEGRFIHAKALIGLTKNADHLLFGSANCTLAALGTQSYAGANEEACLYRRLPVGTILEALGLTNGLTDEKRVVPADLKQPEHGEDIPLDALDAQTPGTFTVHADTLTWKPATSITDPDACTIALRDRYGAKLLAQLSRLARSEGQEHRFRISATDRYPAFGYITHANGGTSAPSIVTHMDTLRSVIRETYSRQTENALRQLDGETEASLALLEVLDLLEKIEQGDAPPGGESLSIPKADKQDDDSQDTTYRILSYEEFIAHRRPHKSGPLRHNSLIGSDVSLVRGFLNRIVGLSTADQSAGDNDDDEAMRAAFDLRDETANAAAALAAGGEFGAARDKPTQWQPDEDAQHSKVVLEKATKAQIVAAASNFRERIGDKQKGSGLTSRDFLRLRALLMILCAAAYPGRKAPRNNRRSGTSLEVLPAEGEADSWPFVMGRVLFKFFRGRYPAIRALQLANEHDQIPGDLIECWATCYWCLQACLAAPLSPSERERIERYIWPLAEDVYRLTLPTAGELLGDDVIAVMTGMNQKHAERLGIDPAALIAGHKRLTKTLFERAETGAVGSRLERKNDERA